jgi:endoglucanase
MDMSHRVSGTGKRWLLIASLLMVTGSGGCKQGPWTLWSAYQARFIDAHGRVIDYTAGDRTTSEGQAYALFFALVDNDRATFDRVTAWTQANLAQNDLKTQLPSWLWGKDASGAWKTLDVNPASDADVWMAYTFVEAGRLWKAPVYAEIGRAMMAEIAAKEVADLPGFGPMLLPGPVGFGHGKSNVRSWTLNPSYVPLFLFERLATVDPNGPWQGIAAGIPRLLEQSSRHGFAMDWVDYVSGDGFYPTTVGAAELDTGNGKSGPGGSYDAIRVYLWAGMTDGRGTARAEMLNALPGMSAYLANHDAPPEKVSDQGVPMAEDGPVGYSAALLPYLRAEPDQSKVSAQQTVRMSKLRDAATGLYGKDLAYYDQNLALFSTGFIEGRFSFGPGGELNVGWKRE